MRKNINPPKDPLIKNVKICCLQIKMLYSIYNDLKKKRNTAIWHQKRGLIPSDCVIDSMSKTGVFVNQRLEV